MQYEKSLHGFRSQTNPSSLPAITENEIMSSSGSQNSQLINSHIDNQTSELINPDGNNQSLRLRGLSAKAGSQHQSPDGISADLVFIEKIPKLDQAKSSPLTRVPIRQTATRIESLTADFVYLPKK